VIFVLMRHLQRAIRRPPSPMRVGVLLAAVIAYGASGFMFFEIAAKPGLTWADAFWWTVVTLTTVGYGDYAPASASGRFFVALPLMVFGIGLLGYVLTLAATALVESKTRELAGMGTMKFDKHVVIVNMPSLGKVERLLDELLHTTGLGPRTDVVLIDEELAQLPIELAERNVHFVRGNPARDETLARAAISTASFAVVLSRRAGDPHSDDQAVAVVLAIEAHNRAIHSVVECVDPSMEELLRKAGSDSIVCTARFDAHFVVSEILNPGAQEVVDHLLSTIHGGQQLFMTKVARPGVTFGELSKTCSQRGHVAIGVKQDGKLRLNAALDSVVREGDLVVTIGAKGLDLAAP
jgi:voltage-gated potassium channel